MTHQMRPVEGLRQMIGGKVEALYAGVDEGVLVKDTVTGGLLAPHQSYRSREGSPSSQRPQLVLRFE
jgi:hypothetical protein